MSFDRLKALLADDMLHFAGILGSDLFVYAKADQPEESSECRS